MNQSIGKLLKSTREAKGLTISEVAFQLKTKTSVVEALEKEDFTALAAPIYVRGFLRKYAELLNLPQNELIDTFNKYFLPEMQKKLNPSLAKSHTIKSKEVPIIRPAISPIPPEEKNIHKAIVDENLSEMYEVSTTSPLIQNTNVSSYPQASSPKTKKIQPVLHIKKIASSLKKLVEPILQNAPLVILVLLIITIIGFLIIKSLQFAPTEKSKLLAQPPPPYLDARTLRE